MGKKFVRARQPEQREERRAQILAAARATLRVQDPSSLSLTALARASHMAKSNVYRYFESREAVLLAVLEVEWEEWCQDLAARMQTKRGATSTSLSVDTLALRIAELTAQRPLMCQLISIMPTVLEHNVTTETVASFKARSLGLLSDAAHALHEALPTHSVEQFAELIHQLIPFLIGLWPLANPSPVTAEVLAAPEAAPFRHDVVVDIKRMVVLMLRGMRDDQE